MTLKLRDLARKLHREGVPFVAYDFDTGGESGCGVFRLDEVEVHYTKPVKTSYGRPAWVDAVTHKRLSPAKVRAHFRKISNTCDHPVWWIYGGGLDDMTRELYRQGIKDACPDAREGELNDLLT